MIISSKSIVLSFLYLQKPIFSQVEIYQVKYLYGKLKKMTKFKFNN